MGKVVAILTDVYFPHPMAGGICAHQLAKGFVEKGYEVHIICYFRKGEKKEDSIEGIHVHRIKMPLVNVIRDCSERIKSAPISRLVYRFAIFINRFLKILYLKKYPMKSPLLVKRYITCAKKIEADIVIGEFFSIESAYAACLLKQKYGLKCVVYNVDSLSNSDPAVGLSLSFVRRKGLEWEKKLFTIADCIAIMKCHENHYKDKTFDEYRNKIGIVDLPLMELSDYSNNNVVSFAKNNKSIIWLYTGSLSHSIRTPDYLLKILEKIDLHIEMNFFSKGDCEQDIAKAIQRQNVSVLQHGHIPKKDLEKEYANADFLISIGNLVGDFLPSKTIEYIAHCKPIIHFCYQKFDASLPYLEKYGHALIIKVNDGTIEEHTRSIEMFVQRYLEDKIIINSQLVADLFHENIPSSSVEMIEKILFSNK